MKPYYEQDGITIYHGDALEVLGEHGTDSINTVIADPPYNGGKQYGVHNDSMPPEKYQAWMIDVFELLRQVTMDSVIFFPGTKNVFQAPTWLQHPLKVHRMLGWHRKEFAGDKWVGGPAMSWEPVLWASKADKPAYNRIYGTVGRDFLIVPSVRLNPYSKVHPCPKPLPVMMWLVALFVPEGGVVLDPFMGTGTTLRAAKNLGRRAIGIEIEEKYCEIAVERLAQGVLF